MSGISAKTELMEDRGKDFKECSEEMGRTVERMQGLVTELENVWASDASTRFIEQFEGLKPQLQEAVEMANAIGEQLISIAQTYASVDEEIAGKMLTF